MYIYYKTTDSFYVRSYAPAPPKDSIYCSCEASRLLYLNDPRCKKVKLRTAITLPLPHFALPKVNFFIIFTHIYYVNKYLFLLV